jgi:hypothetical protein
MTQKCHGHNCNKDIDDNYYCEDCFNELQNQKQKQEQKPKLNKAKDIHKAMLG